MKREASSVPAHVRGGRIPRGELTEVRSKEEQENT